MIPIIRTPSTVLSMGVTSVRVKQPQDYEPQVGDVHLLMVAAVPGTTVWAPSGWEWADGPVEGATVDGVLLEMTRFMRVVSDPAAELPTVELSRPCQCEVTLIAVRPGAEELPGTPASFRCPVCGAVSHNPNDIREKYCGACHWWTGDPSVDYLRPKTGETR